MGALLAPRYHEWQLKAILGRLVTKSLTVGK